MQELFACAPVFYKKTAVQVYNYFSAEQIRMSIGLKNLSSAGKPIKTEFTANNQSDKVVVKPGTVVEFVCRSSKMPLTIKVHHNGKSIN